MPAGAQDLDLERPGLSLLLSRMSAPHRAAPRRKEVAIVELVL
jgi:hypothetical protein